MGRDKTYDYVFAGVTSTGIYCRSVCPAKNRSQTSDSFYRAVRPKQPDFGRASDIARLSENITTSITLPKSFDFDWLLSFLRFRAVAEIEEVTANSYRRSLRLEEGPVTIEITKERMLFGRAMGRIDKVRLNTIITESSMSMLI